VLEDGTAIGDAVATALNRLRDSEAKSRVVVLDYRRRQQRGHGSRHSMPPRPPRRWASPCIHILVGKGGKVPFPAGQDLFGRTAWRDVEIAINPELLR
jgi:Ca-activated chloride channel family protein